MSSGESSTAALSSSVRNSQASYGATGRSTLRQTHDENHKHDQERDTLTVNNGSEHERPLSTRTGRSRSEHTRERDESSSLRRKRRDRRSAIRRVGLTLANTGSVARDHLASERTFLAYVRTSLGIASMGVAIVQLFRLTPVNGSKRSDPHHHLQLFAQALGAVLVVTGLLTLAIGLMRYFAVQRALVEGKFPASQAVVLLPAAILGIVICVVFGVLVVFRLQDPAS